MSAWNKASQLDDQASSNHHPSRWKQEQEDIFSNHATAKTEWTKHWEKDHWTKKKRTAHFWYSWGMTHLQFDQFLCCVETPPTPKNEAKLHPRVMNSTEEPFWETTCATCSPWLTSRIAWTGHQWKWGIDRPSSGGFLGTSDKVLFCLIEILRSLSRKSFMWKTSWEAEQKHVGRVELVSAGVRNHFDRSSKGNEKSIC